MRFTKKTEYGLICLVRMAKIQDEKPLPIKEMVGGEEISQAFAEKICQRLRAASIVASQQGKQGGYVLARPAGEITLRQIVEALEGRTFDVLCTPSKKGGIVCGHFDVCGVKSVWERTKDLIDRSFDSVTLEMIARGDMRAFGTEGVKQQAVGRKLEARGRKGKSAVS